MAVGLGVLGLAPQQFWQMTPSELTAAVSGLRGSSAHDAPPGRDDLGAMMARYPDKNC